MTIPYSRQSITAADIKAVSQVLQSDWLTTGPRVDKFEWAVIKFVRVKYGVAVTNGTAALHLACLAVGLGPADEVIVPTYSFAASANCVLFCGARPVLVDIDEPTLNIDIKQVEKKINKRTRAIMGVDFGGRPADWKGLRKLARKYNLKLIDDAAHSFGTEYQGERIGTQADLTCFSFHPVKTITTGEGGMVVTNNKKVYERLLMLRNHGIIKAQMSKSKFQMPWYYEMRELGFNYRLTDLQCALGLAQLKRAEKFLARRRRLAGRYNQKLANLPNLILPKDDKKSAWHLYPLRIDFRALGKSKEQLFKLMQRHGISLQVHYIPIHLQPYYRQKFGYKPGDFPVAEKVYQQEVSLPLYPTLTYKQQGRVINLLKKFVG